MIKYLGEKKAAYTHGTYLANWLPLT